MKKRMNVMLALLLTLSMTALVGCSSKTEDPGTPPAEVINPENSTDDGVQSESSTDDSAQIDNSTDDSVQSENSGTADEGDVLEHAVSVRIGKESQKDWSIDMYHNDAALTMLDYLSDTGLLFPTYTYEDEQGFVAQNVRGTYTRDDETTVEDVKTGELYLFSDGQLRFYFKDMAGVNITATPVGYYTETEGLTEAVQEAYESNLGDTWGVDVYFLITKTLE